MHSGFGRTGAVLALAALLGGCSRWVTPVFTPEADAAAGTGAPFLAPWSSPRPVALANSYTVERLLGAGAGASGERLELEPGNVWPAEEAPRATLANPDAALRGVPPWRPGEERSREDLPGDPRPGGPLARPRADATVPDNEQRPLRRRRDAASSSPPPLELYEPERVQVLPVPPGANSPPPRRADGQVVLPPGGPPLITSGGNDRIQTFNPPGGGGGVIHRDGGVTTVIPSGAPPLTFPTPR